MLLPSGRTLAVDRPLIMGILNVTPDSFSDGGRFNAVDRALAHGLEMAAQGADVIDVGGESTRPGAERIEAGQQIQRTAPVIEALRHRLDECGFDRVVVSIDTTRLAVARAAVQGGAEFLNDVSAARDEPEILRFAADRGLAVALMHMRGRPKTMQEHPVYEDVVRSVRQFLLERAQAAMDVGMSRERVWLDPGIGFGKSKGHNLSLLAALPRLTALGHPLLLGTSRKRFMGAICHRGEGASPAPEQLLGATCATTALGVAAGVKMFRVHDVAPNRQAADVAWAITAAADSSTSP